MRTDPRLDYLANLESLYTVDQAAEYLGCSKKTIYQYRWAGRLTAIKYMKKALFDPRELVQFKKSLLKIG